MSDYTLTWEKARQAIYAHFIAEWGAHLPYFFEGQQPDMNTQTSPFVTVEVLPTRIEQVAMRGNDPPKRAWGQIDVTVFLPMSVGAKTRMDTIDKFTQMFCARTVGVLVYRGNNVLPVVEGKDWRSQSVLADFYFEYHV